MPYSVELGMSHWVLWHHPQHNLPGDSELQPAEELRLLEILLGVSVRSSEAIVFQNVPTMRSIPTIAHSHVFFRPEEDLDGKKLAEKLESRRTNWVNRSPWLNRK